MKRWPAVLAALVLVGTPAGVVAVAAPSAFADVVLGACDFPSNPTVSDHAECHGDDLGAPSYPDLDADYADLSDTSVQFRANLSSGHFVDTDLAGASWSDVALLSANLSGANLTGADFNDAIETGANFTGAVLQGTDMANGVFGGASLADANLTDTDFEGGQFGTSGDLTTFTGATLTGATFTDTNLLPASVTTAATGPAGAAVTWAAPQTETGEQLGTCSDTAGTVISGSTFPVGTTTVTCDVTDTGTSTHGTGTFTITVTGVAPGITGPTSATFITGQAGSATFSATGDPAPAFTESGALPSGVTFTSKGNGTATLAGTPATGTAGTYPLAITASNGVQPDATRSFTLGVLAPLAVTGTVPAGTVGTAYHTTLTATGGTAPYRWAVASGSKLPPGLSLAADGAVSGTPTTEGTFRTTVAVTDSTPGQTLAATAALSFTVAQAPWSGRATTGIPDPAARQAQGFYLGVDGESWRLEVTQRHSPTNLYRGTITINTGAFSQVTRARLESDDALSHTPKTITFAFHDSAGIDGVNFVTPAAATTLTFTLSINGTKATTSEVFLGKAPHGHPGAVPFSIRRA